MDHQQSEHLSRVRHLRQSFAEANEHLVNRLRAAADDEAEARRPRRVVGRPDRPARRRREHAIRRAACHDVPAAKPLEHGFVERPWVEVAAAIPPKLQDAAAAQPHGPVTRHDAIGALEASAVKMARAFDTLTPDRGARVGVTSPVVGTINLHQVGEWAIANVRRRDAQAERALTRGRNRETS